MKPFLALVLLALPLAAQDREWVATWEEAQRHRPNNVAAAARIAPAGEPGTPLVVRGRILQSDGKKPAANVIVFAYQTDAKGVYNHNNARGWRLRGWARTDAQGRFEFQTIRPASYPNTRTPAHIHLTVEGPGLPRRWTPEIHFRDDPLAARMTDPSPVATRNGVQFVDYVYRIANDGRF
jgi:protocatechuate 3,4-dioxygenase beta subunit